MNVYFDFLLGVFCPLSTWLTGGDDDPTAWII